MFSEYFVFPPPFYELKDLNIQNHNFTVVLYGCGIWSLMLREHRLRVPEKRVLRRIFGPEGGCGGRLEKTT
jgi:hypothetical protein